MSSVNGKGGLYPIDVMGMTQRSFRTREYPIASGYATAIFKGDIVAPVNDGTIQRGVFNFTSGSGFLGVFLGCRFTNPSTNQPTWSNYYPASTVATDIKALVCDDPQAVYLIQGDGSLALTNIFNNADLAQTATGSTLNGLSGMNLSASSAATTNTLRFRIIELYKSPDNAFGDAFTKVLVCINRPGFHFFDQATGV
jgi:hypothetical protein